MLYAVRVTPCCREDKKKAVWRNCGKIAQIYVLLAFKRLCSSVTPKAIVWMYTHPHPMLFDHFSLLTVYFLQKTIESVALRLYLHIGSIYRTCT